MPRRIPPTFLIMLLAAANCGHSCGQSKEDYAYTSCANLQEGAPCRAVISTTCEEKQHANPACNVTWKCEFPDDKWRKLPPKAECPTSCPPAFTTNFPGACDAKGVTPPLCEYAEGICGCTPTGAWKCVPRSVRGGDLDECPGIRPAGGASGCPSEEHFPENNLSCSYGDADLLGAVSADCLHHSWTLVNHREDSALGR